MGLIQLDPPIWASVSEVASGVWAMGSLMILEKNPERTDGCLAEWKSGNDTLCIRKRDQLRDGPHPVPTEESLGSEMQVLHRNGTRRAVWALGDTFIKVREWVKEMDLEGEIVNRVKELGMPTPEILFEWTDPAFIRSFLILRKLEGATLNQLWTSLSTSQREGVAAQVAELVHLLATKNQSPKMCTLAGNGVWEERLMGAPPWPQIPGQKRFLGPCTLDELKSHISSIRSKEDFLPENDTFHLFHADTGPTNIILSSDLTVTLIDWELTAFYPRSWIYVKTRTSPGYCLYGDGISEEEEAAWNLMLGEELAKKGLTGDKEAYLRWRQG